jgi:putative N6-adenine-specific DNA methylase
MKHKWYASISPGFEPVLSKELLSHNLEAQLERGGVSFVAQWNTVQQLSNYLRTPTSLRLKVIENEPIDKLSDLRILLNGYPWTTIFPEGTQPIVKATCKKSKLNRSDIIQTKAQRILNAILKSSDGPTIPIVVRIVQNHLWVSVQLHQDLLHKRGWRKQQVRAPLRENWAACLLEIANWQPDETLLDPFCGSGTILIEAARKALDLPTHLESPFKWKHLNLQFESIKTKKSNGHPTIYGSDRDTTSIEKAKTNAEHASAQIHFQHCAIKDLKAPSSHGLIITNPPYGISSGKKTDSVYHIFGQTLQKHFSNWRVLFLATNAHKAQLVSPFSTRITTFSNGGIPVGVYGLDSFSTSND